MTPTFRLMITWCCLFSLLQSHAQTLEPKIDHNYHEDLIARVAYSDDGALMALQSGIGTITVHHVETGKVMREITHETPIIYLNFLPKSDSLIVVDCDSDVRLNLTTEDESQDEDPKIKFFKVKALQGDFKKIGELEVEPFPTNKSWKIDLSTAGTYLSLLFPEGELILFNLTNPTQLYRQNTVGYQTAGFKSDTSLITYTKNGGSWKKLELDVSLAITDSTTVQYDTLIKDLDNRNIFIKDDQTIFVDHELEIEQVVEFSNEDAGSESHNSGRLPRTPFMIEDFRFSSNGRFMGFCGGEPESFWATVGSLPHINTLGISGMIDCRRNKVKWMNIVDDLEISRRAMSGYFKDDNTYSLTDERGGVILYNAFDGGLIETKSTVVTHPVSFDISEAFDEIFYSVFDNNTYSFSFRNLGQPFPLGDEFFRYTKINNKGLKVGAFTFGFHGNMDKSVFDGGINTAFTFPLYGINHLDLSESSSTWVYNTRILQNYAVLEDPHPYNLLEELNFGSSMKAHLNNETVFFETDSLYTITPNREIAFDNTVYLLAVSFDQGNQPFISKIVPSDVVIDVELSRDGNYLSYLQEAYVVDTTNDLSNPVFNLRTGQWLEFESYNNVHSLRTFFDEHVTAGLSIMPDKTALLWSTTDGSVMEAGKFNYPIPGDIKIDQDHRRLLFIQGDELMILEFGGDEFKEFRIPLPLDLHSGELHENRSGKYLNIYSKMTGVSVLIDVDGCIKEGKLEGKGLVKRWNIRRDQITEALYNDYEPVHFHKDVPIAAVFDGNSSIELLHLGTKEVLLTLILYPDGEWLVYNPQGYFDASSAARQYFYYVSDDEPLLYNQLKEKYWDPGLVRTTLTNFNDLPYESQENLPLYPAVKEFECSEEGLVNIVLEERSGGIGKVSFFINGKEVEQNINTGSQKSIELNLLDYRDYLFTSSVNQIGCVTYNQEGWLGSRMNELYLDTELDAARGGGKKPKFGRTTKSQKSSVVDSPAFFGLFIGTSTYNNPKLNLTFSDKDAHSLKEAFEKVGSDLFDQERSKYYEFTSDSPLKGQASKKNIIKAFEEVSEVAGPNDIVMVFLSGHGVTLDDDFYYLMKGAGNVDLDDDIGGRMGVTLSSSEIQEFLRKIKSTKQMLVIDACHSGQAAEVFINNSKSVNTSQEKALEQLQDKMGVFIMASSESNQKSYETTLLAQGILTYCLLDGMSGSAMEETDDIINVLDLFSYTSKSVESVSGTILGKRQRPVLGIAQGANTFPIGIKNDELKVVLPEEKPQMGRPNIFMNDDWNDPHGLSRELSRRIQTRGALGGTAPFVFTKNERQKDLIHIAGVYERKRNDFVVKWNVLKNQEVWIPNLETKGADSDIPQLMNKVLNITERALIERKD